jgi:hypothetical protein
MLGRLGNLSIPLLLFMSALVACAGKQVVGGGMQDDGMVGERRYASSRDSVLSAAARAFTELGYSGVTRDSEATEGLIQTEPRFTWDECVPADVAAASKHPGVFVYAGTRRKGDSTLFRVGVETLTKVPDVVVRGTSMNADGLVKVCAIRSLIGRVDSLLGELPRAREASAVAQTSIAAPDTTEYHQLVTRLQGGDTLVDYTALRMAYTRTAEYEPYPVRWDANHAMLEALEDRRFADAQATANMILTTNYVDADAHLSAMAAAYSQGDSARGRFHGAVYRGLIASIHNRSGSTPDSAIVVLSIPEEYALLRALGLERTTVAGMQCGPNLCVRMDVRSRKTREKSVLYFDVGIPQAWAIKLLERRR